jgi:hypothetical protein
VDQKTNNDVAVPGPPNLAQHQVQEESSQELLEIASLPRRGAISGLSPLVSLEDRSDQGFLAVLLSDSPLTRPDLLPESEPSIHQPPFHAQTQLYGELNSHDLLDHFLRQRNLEAATMNDHQEVDAHPPSPSNTSTIADATKETVEDSNPPASSFTDRVENSAFPPDFVSPIIKLPEIWTRPSEEHHYICSIKLLQRRALIHLLEQDCTVALTEAENMQVPDLVIDSHSAVVLVTISNVVLSTIPALVSSISHLGHSFERILVILESFPINRAEYSAERLNNRAWSDLRLITDHSITSCLKLKKHLAISIALLGTDELDFGDVHVEFVVAESVTDSARLIRSFGDYAELAVSELERQKLWDDRSWLDTVV